MIAPAFAPGGRKVNRANAYSVILVLCLTGCDGREDSCPVAERVQVRLQDRSFTFPVELKPTILGAPDARLPSYKERDDQGRWAYCQGPNDPPALAESVSLYPPISEMPDAGFLFLGRGSSPSRPALSTYPMRKESGFEVTRTRKIVYVFSQAGAARSGSVRAHCLAAEAGILHACRITFVTHSGVRVTFDLRDAQPLSRWKGIISEVETYVAGFESVAAS